MWVESSGLPGEGATFSFSLPLLDPQGVTSAAGLSQAQSQATHQNGDNSKRGNADLSSLSPPIEQASKSKEQPRQEVVSR